jgi:hypothetical protein
MATNPLEKDKEKADNKDAAVKPDQETLHTTDPQEHMEGPISSLVKGAGEELETEEDKKDEDE